ncbi:42_t:CDS:1, partial [Gigaspora margarita]
SPTFFAINICTMPEKFAFIAFISRSLVSIKLPIEPPGTENLDCKEDKKEVEDNKGDLLL